LREAELAAAPEERSTQAPARSEREAAAARAAGDEAASGTPAVAPAAAQVQAQALAAEEAMTVAQYRIELLAAARRFRRYPRIALDNHWEGRAEIGLVFGPNGQLTEVTVRASSGYPVLDREASEMLRRAAAATPVPLGLRGRLLRIDVPVIFSLRDEP